MAFIVIRATPMVSKSGGEGLELFYRANLVVDFDCLFSYNAFLVIATLTEYQYQLTHTLKIVMNNLIIIHKNQ